MRHSRRIPPRILPGDGFQTGADFFTNTADILCCPCTMVPPFDVKTRWLRECEGWELRSYIDWLMPTSVLSLTNW